jgi:hypothetical protein
MHHFFKKYTNNKFYPIDVIVKIDSHKNNIF